MKYAKLLKLNILIFMLAFSAGIIFLTSGFFGLLPKGTTVNGIDVGGKSRAEAAQTVRQDIINRLKEKSLTVHGNNADYVFTYPEISWKDNLQTLLRTVKKRGEYTAQVSYFLNGISEVTAQICNDESSPLIEPYAVFNDTGEPFEYFEGRDGIRADRLKLLSDIRASLDGDFCDVYVSVKTITRKTSLETVKYDTRLLSSFTTRFDGTNSDRAHNIRLAADMINGTVLDKNALFSFNQTVGERSRERGFKTAKIIENGEFVEGTGGGVCQVSTTLFNAALLSGCEITEFHPHSLAVSYVPPSFDAMVSGTYFDLKFQNTTGYRLYIRAETGKNSITFSVYGRGDGARYNFNSVVTGSITAPVEITDDSLRVRDGKDGTISEGYLTVTRNGITTTKLYRRDKYAPLKRIVMDAAAEEQNPAPDEGDGEVPQIQ